MSKISDDYKDCLSYIEKYWDKIIVKNPKESKNAHFVPLPKPYLTPNDKKFKYAFYWDTFFMFRGLLGTKRVQIMKDMIANFIYLFKKYGIIPNFNSYAATGRSQPPFLSTMIFDIYEITKDDKWLESQMQYAKLEYMDVWYDKNKAYNHTVTGFNLSKYGDRDVGYAHTAELESGWDFTSRFYNRCGDFLPIDLNSYLYKYERDFLRISQMFGYKKEIDFWEEQSKKRKEEMYKYCWSQKDNFFFDYDFVNKKKSAFYSLAGFAPLWAGVVKPSDAEKMVSNLSKFECDYGLMITSSDSLAPNVLSSNVPETYRWAIESLLKPKQWDYPNIWTPIEYLTVVGLLRYGFVDDAVRIMKKSLKAHARVFRKYHVFYEKIDGSTGDKAKSHHYETQEGFGWTNAVFYRYVKLLETIEDKGHDALYKLPKPSKPPFLFQVAH
jgi:alpha,alpha-trehalase